MYDFTNINNLLKKISNNIKEIDRSIKSKKLNKGIMFCANRNFTMIEKRKYGLYIRLLPVEDKDNPKGEEKEKEETTEDDGDSLFTDKPESVGGGKDNIEEKEDAPHKGEDTSPKNFYSSIAKALKEEGIFPDLDEEGLSKVKSPEDFRDLVEQQIKSGLEERQKRIDDALNAGVEPTEIRRYENTINYLYSIKDDI